MKLLSHRGNLDGPDAASENTLRQVRAALGAGFGLETDIRRDCDGTLYVSHDRSRESGGRLAADHAACWAAWPDREIALNVKELGYEAELVDFLGRYRLQSQVFLFDFELLEKRPGATAAAIHRLDDEVRAAVRISDRNGETLERAASNLAASVIWLDEFDSLWVTEEIVIRMKAQGRPIYAISPEIHGRTLKASETRWRQFQQWGIQGICTDYPLRAQAVLGSDPTGC